MSSRGRSVDDQVTLKRKRDRHKERGAKKCPYCTKVLRKSQFYVHRKSCTPPTTSVAQSASDEEISTDSDNDDGDGYIDGDEYEEAETTEWITDDDEEEDLAEDMREFPREVWVEDEEEVQMQEDVGGEVEDVNLNGDEDIRECPPYVTLLIKAHLLHLLQLQSKHSMSDAAFIGFWLCFVSLLDQLFKSFTDVPGVDNVIKFLPKTLHAIRKFLNLNRDGFTKFVMCHKCDTRHTMEEAVVQTPDGMRRSATCSSVKFATHRQRRWRRRCGEPLMSCVVSKNGKKNLLYPRSLYCYKPVKESLETLINREGFLETCESWRKHFHLDDPGNSEETDKIFSDVYDAQVWKKFQFVNDSPFLSEPGNFGLMMNIDWFQPFKYSRYSVGAIYMVVMNLPRNLRYKVENCLVVGLIPGPHEPKLNVNSYLQPLVSELIDLWEGVTVTDRTQFIGERKIRAALLGLSSDVPATRKCGGFVGFGATKGCSKCKNSFPRLNNTLKADYSDFESELVPRHGDEHKRLARATLSSNSQAEKTRLEMENGVRYSALFDLPYFDPIKMHVIDPMHNLAGTTSHVMNVWKEVGIISDDNLLGIQSRVDSLKIPSDMGRIVNKIDANFSGLTADQLLHWTCVYSLYALKEHIGTRHYNIWRLFVTATRLLCQRRISLSDARTADVVIKMFCIKFRDEYGSKYCTPNMHLHLHLVECIMLYGPVYAFWCFSFERYNGILENYTTNNRDVGIQLMRKFVLSRAVTEEMLHIDPADFDPSTIPVHREHTERGTLGQYTSEVWHNRHKFVTGDRLRAVNWEYNDELCKYYYFVKPHVTTVMNDEETGMIHRLCTKLYPDGLIKRISNNCSSVGKCVIAGELVTVQKAESDRSACVEARWIEVVDGEIGVNPSADFRPAIVSDFILCTLILNDRSRRQIPLVKLKWFTDHPDRFHYGQTSPVSVWGVQFYDELSDYCFMPLQRIRGRCAYVKTKLKLGGNRVETVKVVVSLTSGVS